MQLGRAKSLPPTRTSAGGGVVLLSLLLATTAHAHHADVENIPPKRYFEVALNEIQQAESSIHLYMYLVSLPSARPGSKVYQLVDALIEAKDHGVDVRVVLDQNIDWVDKSESGKWALAGKNKRAARYLLDNGVGVYFDDEAIYTHAKVLIIDEETVILGSTNWTESALTRNVEGNVLIRSPEVAQEMLEQFKGVGQYQPAVSAGSTVRVPVAHISSPKILGRMVTDRDPRALDAYLYLLRIYESNEVEEIELDYAPLIEEIGVQSSVEWNDRAAVREVLERLQDKYGLVSFEATQGDGLVVILTETNGQIIQVPFGYWEWGWSRELSFAGKVMYLLNEMYSAMSPEAPSWFRSQEDIAERHGFSIWFVGDGILDLRRHNLIEVETSPLNPADYTDREANRYMPNPLYDLEELEQSRKALERVFGKAKVRRAVRHASAVYEDSDYRAISRLIVLEEEFGQEVVKQAVEVVGGMSGNNPKKTIAYLIGTIQGIGGR